LIPFDKSLVFVLETDELHGMADQRAFFLKLEEMELRCAGDSEEELYF
jgi:(E)-4-hydroxy-3-methylbut-2-enyl-diphosphate synthase